MLLGCIADDFTGASDLANTLTRAGARTVLAIDVPGAGTPAPDADAVVVALKTRSIASDDAVARSLAALAWLRAHGARQVLFKICSTFDSTPEGNIGPVAQALSRRSARRSPSSAPPSRRTRAPSTWATCSSASGRCTRAAWNTIR
jgi:uncharacterized protein YgbK (DUF1537 family)